MKPCTVKDPRQDASSVAIFGHKEDTGADIRFRCTHATETSPEHKRELRQGLVASKACGCSRYTESVFKIQFQRCAPSFGGKQEHTMFDQPFYKKPCTSLEVMVQAADPLCDSWKEVYTMALRKLPAVVCGGLSVTAGESRRSVVTDATLEEMGKAQDQLVADLPTSWDPECRQSPTRASYSYGKHAALPLANVIYQNLVWRAWNGALANRGRQTGISKPAPMKRTGAAGYIAGKALEACIIESYSENDWDNGIKIVPWRRPYYHCALRYLEWLTPLPDIVATGVYANGCALDSGTMKGICLCIAQRVLGGRRLDDGS
eukprot:gene15887-22015_t